MSVFRSRGEIVQPTDTVRLRASFFDTTGALTDLSSFPTVSIVSPSGLVSVSPSSAGVYAVETGIYGYDYEIGINGPIGVYNDIWRGVNGSQVIILSHNFVCDTTQLPAINSDGYVHLGDDVGFNYSQLAIQNINKVIKGVRARLKSQGKAKRVDEDGNVTYIDCDIYSVDVLVTFCAMALSNFNLIPYFTTFTYEDTEIIDQFCEILVQGAVLYALASQALIERGREFQISDNGLQFTPPTVSELLSSQWGTGLTSYNEQVKYVKNSMRPAPKGLGTLTITATNPNVSRLRHLRARRFF